MTQQEFVEAILRELRVRGERGKEFNRADLEAFVAKCWDDIRNDPDPRRFVDDFADAIVPPDDRKAPP